VDIYQNDMKSDEMGIPTPKAIGIKEKNDTDSSTP
jgi:hypothetical protein